MQEVVLHPPGVVALSPLHLVSVQLVSDLIPWLVPQLKPQLVPQLKLQLVSVVPSQVYLLLIQITVPDLELSQPVLDTLTCLKQMRLAEHRADFQPYHSDT